MAQDFTAPGYIRTLSVPVSAMPLSMACWYLRPSLVDVTSRLIGLQDLTGQNAYSIETQGASGIQVRAVSTEAGSIVRANSSYSGAANAWSHAAAVFTSPTLRRAYSNGAGVSNSANSNPAAPTEWDIGGYFTSGTPSTIFPGQLAEIGIWNVALTDTEVASLAVGISPLHIRPTNLVFYAPLVRDVKDLKGLTLSPTSLSVVAHPRIYP